MFKLVGKETFCVGAAKTKATINIDAVSGFAYEYTLEMDGKSLKKYMENRSKTTNTWVLHLAGEDWRVVLGESGLLLQNPLALMMSGPTDFCGRFHWRGNISPAVLLPSCSNGDPFNPTGFCCSVVIPGLIRLALMTIILG